MIRALLNALSGLRAFSTGTAVASNNIANSLTDNFKATRARYQETSDGGVKVTLSQDPTPGAPVVDPSTGNTVAGAETSNVDISQEIVDLMQNSHAFKANLASIRTADEMQKNVIDIIT